MFVASAGRRAGVAQSSFRREEAIHSHCDSEQNRDLGSGGGRIFNAGAILLPRIAARVQTAAKECVVCKA